MLPGDLYILFIGAALASFLASTRESMTLRRNSYAVKPLHLCYRRLFAVVCRTKDSFKLNYASPAYAYSAYTSAGTFFAVILLVMSISGCVGSSAETSADSQQAAGSARTLLSLRPKADPAMVARIIEEERKQAERQSQAAIYAETAGPEQVQSCLGRTLPNVSRDPISNALIAPPAESVSANGTILGSNNTVLASNNTAHTSYHEENQLANYESAYSSVPPPPPGALGAGLVPPPPAVTLSTQAQTVANANAAAFYNNPYFNPFGVPAPPQASAPSRRPSGLFGEGASGAPSEDAANTNSVQKHRADFVPITPRGMEARSPYKQRDDLRILWKGILSGSTSLGDLSENNKLIEQLTHADIGLPSESTKGSFNISSRQVESVFKASSIDNIDKRIFPEVRKLQTELAQAYYRYLSTYNKYALIEQTVAARKQEVDLSESDAEKQRAAADLSQSQNDLDAAKDDLRSSQIELAAASSPTAARTVISRVGGSVPSVESLAQGVSQSGNSGRVANHKMKIASLFESVFKHPTTTAAVAEGPADLSESPDEKLSNNSFAKKILADNATTKTNKNKEKKDKKEKNGLFGRLTSHSQDDKDLAQSNDIKAAPKLSQSDDSDLSSAPAPKSFTESEPQHAHALSSSPSTSKVSFVLKNVNVNPRKSVLNVSVKNSASEPFELNPDAIYIAEGNRKLGAAALRADFDTTSIEPNQEVKGTITIFSRPWNDRLVIYLADGNKTIQLKR